LYFIGAFDNIIWFIREVSGHWTLDKETNVKKIVSQMEIKIE
jgi:hypothetical protein